MSKCQMSDHLFLQSYFCYRHILLPYNINKLNFGFFLLISGCDQNWLLVLMCVLWFLLSIRWMSFSRLWSHMTRSTSQSPVWLWWNRSIWEKPSSTLTKFGPNLRLQPVSVPGRSTSSDTMRSVGEPMRGFRANKQTQGRNNNSSRKPLTQLCQ